MMGILSCTEHFVLPQALPFLRCLFYRKSSCSRRMFGLSPGDIPLHRKQRAMNKMRSYRLTQSARAACTADVGYVRW